MLRGYDNRKFNSELATHQLQAGVTDQVFMAKPANQRLKRQQRLLAFVHIERILDHLRCMLNDSESIRLELGGKQLQ